MRKNYRKYKYKNIKLRRRLLSLLLAASLGIGGIALVKHLKHNSKSIDSSLEDEMVDEIDETSLEILGFGDEVVEEPIEYGEQAFETISVPQPVNNFNKGDSVITTSSVNMRLNADKGSFRIGEVPSNVTVDRIAKVGNWDLIRYNNQLAFVCSDYTAETYDYNNEYYTVEEYNDIVRTTSKLYFRVGPSKNEKDICLLGKNEELVVIGKATIFNDQDDIWYLVKYKDKIGFVCADYTRSLKDTLLSQDPNISDLKILNVGYLKNDSNIYNYQGNVIDRVEAYQAVKVLEDKGNEYLVEIGNTIGLVSKDNVKTYSGVFVMVDLSDQKVYLYCNTDMVFESACTTGSDKTPTDVGAFSVYERTNQRYFSEEAQARYMWANFDHGNGFHDAPWEPESKFGSNSYRKRNGSKGCVRLPDEAALFLKDYIKKDTKVLVKK